MVLSRVKEIPEFKMLECTVSGGFQPLSASCSLRKLVLFTKPGLKGCKYLMQVFDCQVWGDLGLCELKKGWVSYFWI